MGLNSPHYFFGSNVDIFVDRNNGKRSQSFGSCSLPVCLPAWLAGWLTGWLSVCLLAWLAD